MTFTVKRNDDVSYSIPFENTTLLEALTHVKRTLDPSLNFASGCRSEVCGSCAVRVNGKEVLACSYKLQEGDYVQPLRYLPLIKDLVVNHDQTQELLKRAKNVSTRSHTAAMTPADEHAIGVQSDCILCGACYSACPVEAVNPDFLGPFALTRSWRYVNDTREENTTPIMDAIQDKGIWDCTLCNECSLVCPQNISSKSDISMLQSKAGILGYMNPNFGGGSFGGFDQGFGTPDFGAPSF